MNVSIRLALGIVFAAMVAAACNGGGDPDPIPTPTAEVSPTITDPPTPPDPTTSGIRVAYLNLMAPISIDDEEGVERATFADRTDIAIDELRAFSPDLIGVSEAAWAEGLGSSAWARLVDGLQYEGTILARANPWIFGQSQADSDALVEEVGWEEGEYLLSRFPIRSSKRYELPSPSLTESRAVLHAVVVAPDPIGEIDVYVTRFGGEDWRLARQAERLLAIISLTHDAERQIIIMGDFGAPPDSEALGILVEAGYLDPLAGAGVLTCCRQGVSFEAAELTPSPVPTPDPSATPDTADPEATGTPEAAPVAGPAEVTIRTDYILVPQWTVETWRLIGSEPVEQSGGQVLFASDHNGIGIVFDIEGAVDSVSR
jgi:endonuclease/exonuclease/phosphatase family metal-dependent hydrolase